MLGNIFFFFSSEKKHQWVQWFPLDEWWYNTTYHEATKMTPYEAFYGKQPHSITFYISRNSNIWVIETLFQIDEWTLASLKDNLAMAQNCMKQQAN